MKTVYVDADACPTNIRHDIAQLTPHDVSVHFIASYAHMSNHKDGCQWTFVDASSESVDLFIINHTNPHDIAVTQDYGLASLLLPKGVSVLSPRGKEYTEYNIEGFLQTRYQASKARRSGKKTKGPRAFTEEDRATFQKTYKKVLSKEGI